MFTPDDRPWAHSVDTAAGAAEGTGVLLLGHGTVSDVKELPAFLTRIRRGRPPSDELLAEMRHRYDAVGGSPLLATSQLQASELGRRWGVPVEAAMRLWAPSVASVIAKHPGVRRWVLVSWAPFSDHVYETAARAELERAGFAGEVVGVGDWAGGDAFAKLHAALVAEASLAEGTPVVLSAHSLPLAVVRHGDPYAKRAEALAARLRGLISQPVYLAYQSVGADGGEWLGPVVEEVMADLLQQGHRTVAVLPFGFQTEHVETMYDLDRELVPRFADRGLVIRRLPVVTSLPAYLPTVAAELRPWIMGAR